MQTPSLKSAFIKLHISIILAGFTGILGKLIVLHEGVLVWYRMILTSLLLFVILKVMKRFRLVNWKQALQMGGVGALLGLHWVFFYGSIKASNVSIGVVCFSMSGFFTALLEPLINRQRFSFKELLFSILTLVGIGLIFHFDTQYQTGIILGTISSLLVAFFTITNKKVSKGHDSLTMLLYELIGGFIVLTLVLPFYFHFLPPVTFTPTPSDVVYLCVLAVFCTIFLYLFQIQALQSLSAFTVNLSYNLEPVYSIIMAMILFGEAKELSLAFYIGLFFIILSVCLQSYSSFKNAKKIPSL